VDFLLRLFDTSGFPARWRCGAGWTESPALGWLHVLSDLGIWTAYLAIPLVLLYFLRQRRDLPFRRIFLLFGAFIFACGTTHLLEAVIFWWPVYRLAGAVKLLTAIVSWTTVFALTGVVPRVLAMRSPEELQREIDARRVAEAQLQQMNSELESRVLQRTNELENAAALLRRERELLQTTLRSIGDAVIVTNEQGQVMFLNGSAQQLTGWNSDEAQGRSLTEVFQIVNETTREVVENPALRALREGVIVGLANHTILLAKDGREIAIDDSAAPIRTEDGVLRGAVLVFRNINEQRRAEAALQKSELRERERAAELDAVLRATPTPIWISHDPDCRQVTGNPASYRLLHTSEGENVSATPSQPLTRTFREYQNDVPLAGNELPLQQAAASGRDIIGSELTIVFDDNGEIRHLYGNASPVLDTSGKVRGAVAAFMDITDLKRSHDELREAARRKDEFLATLAHELRNPLAPIRNSLEVMKRANGDMTLIDHSVVLMERQLHQMVRLVDDLLDLSRITRGKVELRKEHLDVSSVLERAIETNRPIATAQGHQIILDLPGEPLPVWGDGTRLIQVFNNLLNNACKFTPSGGEIIVRIERDGDQVRVVVQDRGVGIPPAMLDRVFEMFTQVDGSIDRSHAGLGIGLTLAKNLVEMHEGTIHAHSEGEGKGSSFTVTLPLSDKLLPENEHEPELPAQARRHRILIVDDNRDAATSLAILLRHMGHDTETAFDGPEALDHVKTVVPDLVLLDLGLPKMSGYEVCRALRQEPFGSTLIIFALTGWGQEEDKRKTAEAGFDGHFVKPVDLKALSNLLATIKNGG
jgi:PAS domain S-box-containing protein